MPNFSDPPQPKRMVKKTVWLNMYPTGSVCYGYYNKEQADVALDRSSLYFQTKEEIEVPEDLF